MARRREKRRSSGLIRVPFVRRCELEFEEGPVRQAFLVNINILGAFVADDHAFHLGQGLSCRFRVPGTENEVSVEGVVAWINARQQHPVHSLPVGFGIEFRELTLEHLDLLRGIVSDWVAAQPAVR